MLNKGNIAGGEPVSAVTITTAHFQKTGRNRVNKLKLTGKTHEMGTVC